MCNKELVPNCDAEKGQELSQFMTSQRQIQTPGTNNTIENNNLVSPSIVGRRPRGRPIGSKNQSKMPVKITSGNPDGYVFEIDGGADISKSVFDYVRRRRMRINILSGSGEVAHAKLRQSTGEIVTLHGRFQIIAISERIFPSSRKYGGLEVLLCGTEGQAVMGNVIPPLVAFGSAFLVGTPFGKIVFENVSLEAYAHNKQEEVSLDAVGHVEEGVGGLLNGE